MKKLYKLKAYNSQVIFGWGEESEADVYCDFINRYRTENLYSYEEVTDDGLKENINKNEEGVNLSDVLLEIAA